MKRILIIAVLLVTSIPILSCGSGSVVRDDASSSKAVASVVTSGPGDPKLTYDLVTQNVNAYIGRRVRWYGTQVSFESTGDAIRATFANVEKWQAGEDMQPFVVQCRSEKDYSNMLRKGWVNGTVGGTQTVGINLGSPSGRETRTPRSVPLLSYP